MADRLLARASVPALSVLSPKRPAGAAPIDPRAFFMLPMGMASEVRNVSGRAVIQLVGELCQRHGADSVGGTVYADFIAQLDAAVADDNVEEIVLDVSSPGGDVAGMFRAADKVRAAAKAKPVTAVVSGYAMSAAYVVISGARLIVLEPFASVGSLGAIVEHKETSLREQREGDTVTLVHAGAHKTDGNNHVPLSDAARERYQSLVDDVMMAIASAVSKGRGIDAGAVVALEAASLRGQEAIDAGLADAEGTMDLVLAPAPARAERVLASGRGARPKAMTQQDSEVQAREFEDHELRHKRGKINATPDRKGEDMRIKSRGRADGDEYEMEARGRASADSDEYEMGSRGRARANGDEDMDAEGDEYDPEARGRARAEYDEDMDAEGDQYDTEAMDDEEYPGARGRSRARASGGSAFVHAHDLARRRIAAIMNHPAARGRETLARHLALGTNMLPSSALAALEASPKSSGGAYEVRGAGVAGASSRPATGYARGEQIAALYNCRVLGKKPVAR